MPLTMLAWSAWLFVAMGLPAEAREATTPALTAAPGGPSTLLVAPAVPDRPDDQPPLWCEAEDEDEREDDSKPAASSLSVVPWSANGHRPILAARPRHPIIRPRSALRSPILLC